MNPTRLSIFVLAMAAVLMMAGCSTETPTNPTVAATTDVAKSVDRDDIAGQLIIGEDVDPGEVRNPGGKVTIITGNAFEVELTGDIVAAAVFVQNARYNASGNGSVTGRVELEEAEVMGVTGELEGQFTGNLKGFYLKGQAVLQGKDELAGCHIRLDFEGMLDSETYDYTGVVMFDDRDWYEIEPDGAIRPNL